MLTLLLAVCEQALLTFQAADNRLDDPFIIDLEKIIARTRLELEAFADGILGGSPNPVSAAEALHGTAVLDAILESAANGGTLVAVQRPSAELAFGPLSFPESRAK